MVSICTQMLTLISGASSFHSNWVYSICTYIEKTNRVWKQHVGQIILSSWGISEGVQLERKVSKPMNYRWSQPPWHSSLQILLHSPSKRTLWRVLHLSAQGKINHKSHFDFNNTFKFLTGILTVSKIMLYSETVEYSIVSLHFLSCQK